jgi:hypothetical protein
LASSQRNSRSQTPRFNGYELVDEPGNIPKPDDFRDHYQLLGTFMVLDQKGNEMRFTYASPGTAEYYRKTGKFVDGVVLVKEIFFTDHAQLTTGDAHWSSRLKQWFAMIKDDKNRFPNNPLWVDGWGWALFKADAPDNSTNHQVDCISCYVPAKTTEWV